MNNVEASSSSSRVPRISQESTRQIDSSRPSPEYKHIGSVQDTVNIQLSTSSTLLQNYFHLSSLRSGPGIRCNPAGLYCRSDAGSLLLPPLIRPSATPQTQD